eukprot:snap_masked-scaffold33_size549341-processed-gene-2.6 protein:Tk11540 transcript:snap_masked-scaffold33_size549341-processed-gene-2.6-mRNA-1 annotation:"Importin-11"
MTDPAAIDFDQWLMSGLEPELSIKDSNYRIIRRRAVWLLGQWSGIIIPLLRSEEDLVVRITAGKALKVVIDDFEFCSEEFEPFLGTSFGQLFHLLKEVKECDTKLSVLNVLAFIIERMGVAIRPLCSDLVQYLPALWEASNDHNMLRCSILATLVFIVQGLGTISQGLAPFLYPVIQLSTNLKDPCSVYLLEDGLELWLTVLHNTKQMNPPLFELAIHIPPILELGSENLRTMIYILQAYILLSPHEFIMNQAQQIGDCLHEQKADLLDEGVLMILRLTELELKVGPSPGPFRNLICSSLKSIYEGEAYPMVMSLHLSIASRLLISHPTEFNQYSIQVAELLQRPHQVVAGRILDVWLDKMIHVTQPDRKKLLSLALTSLITANSPVVLERLYGIFLNVSETLNDITRQDDATGVILDTLIKTPEDLAAEGDDLDYETEHDQRKREAAAQDPIHTINLREYLQGQIHQLKNQLGEAKYKDIMTNMDVETLSNLKEFVYDTILKGMRTKDIAEKFEVSRRTVLNVKKLFEATGSFEKRKSTGRPRSARTEDILNKIKTKVEAEPRSNIRAIARELRVDKMALLTTAQRQKRLDRCKKIITFLKKKPADQVLIFSDEKIFTVDAVSNSRTTRYIAKRPEDVHPSVRYQGRSKHPAGAMMLGVVGSDGKAFPPIWVKGTMDSTQYKRILAYKVFPTLNQTYGMKKKMTTTMSDRVARAFCFSLSPNRTRLVWTRWSFFQMRVLNVPNVTTGMNRDMRKEPIML